MIYYFSGTGNSKWVAEQMAARLDDVAIDITHVQKPLIDESPSVGFVFPIYAWGVSEPMFSFIKRQPVSSSFSFAIGTCGADAGYAMKQLQKTHRFNSCYSVIMPSNYIIGEELEPEEWMKRKLVQAVEEMDQIAKEVMEQQAVYRVHEGKCPWFKSRIIHPLFERFARDTRPFHVNADLCDRCGWCAENCPGKAIVLADDRPKWNQTCYQCLKCLHGCPKQAIEYGEKTKNRERYHLNELLQKNGSDDRM